MTIVEYLQLLDDELRLKRAPRRRFLAEAEDHLRSAADDLVREGRSDADAEREAVTRFGGAAEVARRFAHAAASSTARVAVFWAGLAFLAYAVTAGLFLMTAPSWLRDFPHGAASMLALQIAAVALAVTAIRTLRWRRTLLIDEERLRLVANGALTATLVVGTGAVVELFVALTRPAAAPWADVSALIAIFGLAAVLCVPAALVTTGGYARASGLGAPPKAPTASGRRDELSLADDVATLVPALGGAARAVLRRPMRTCAALACAAFVAVALAQLVGTDSAHHASIIIGALPVGAFETFAIVICFLTLGRPLGLR